MRALLDVNVLIALLDGAHSHHALAMQWFLAEAERGWASCPLTQNGCLRIMSQPRYPNPLPLSEIAARLAEFVAHPVHTFWPDSLSVLDEQKIHLQQSSGPAQLTDIYLLALAVENAGRFVSFDRGIALATVPAARPDNILLL